MQTQSATHLHILVDARTGKLLYNDGDEVREPSAFPEIDYKTTLVFAFEFVDRELMPNLSWRISAHPLNATKEYMLSGGHEYSTNLTPMLCSSAENSNLPGDWMDGSSPDPAAGRLTFRLQTDDPRFAEIAANPTLAKFCSFTIASNFGEESIVLARIPFRPRNRTGESTVGSSGGGGTVSGGMTLNGLSGAVTLANADGEPFPVTGQTIRLPLAEATEFNGLFPCRNPVADLPIANEEFGLCHYLDATFPLLSFAWPVSNLRKITALIRSANPDITGTILLTPVTGKTDQKSLTLHVGAEWSLITIPLSVEAGSIALRRDEGGTLEDGGMVTAILQNITIWEQV